MRKKIVLPVCGLFLLLAFSACFWHDHDTSVSIWDSEDEYSMTTLYEKNKTRKVQRFLDRYLNRDTHISFKYRQVDEIITLDDGTTFYMNSYPGKLKIKFDKTENSGEAYYKMKEICEDIKEILAEN